MITILVSIVNTSEETYMTILWAKNLHFDHEEDIYMSSKIHEESVYDLNLDLLTISS